MPKKLKDLRTNIKTVEDADSLHGQIARLDIFLTKKKSQAESKIATVKSNLEKETAKAVAELAAKEAALTSYIEQHRERFESPRNRITDWGKYGLQKSTRIEIDDPEKALEYVEANEMKDCIKTSLDLSAVRKRVKAKEKIPGCTLTSDDIAHYTVAKSLLDEAKEEA